MTLTAKGNKSQCRKGMHARYGSRHLGLTSENGGENVEHFPLPSCCGLRIACVVCVCVRARVCVCARAEFMTSYMSDTGD